MLMRPKGFNWFKFWTHFFVGGFFGKWGLAGPPRSNSWGMGIAYIVGGALLLGLVAGAASNSNWDE